MALVDEDAANYPHRFYRWLLYDAAGEINSVEALSGGGMSFGVNGLDARTYRVQASTNLLHWQTIGTPTGGRLHFNDPDAAQYSRRFYRLQSGP